MPIWSFRKTLVWTVLLLTGPCLLSRPAVGSNPKRPAIPRAAKQDSSKLTQQAMQLLYANCLSCHNAEKHKGGLQLTSRTAALKGGDEGPVLAPGKPEESLLFKALAPEADPHMPPKKQLSTNQIQLVRRWIMAGAPWDETALAKASAQREVRLEKLPNRYQPAFAVAVSPDGTKLAFGRGNRIMIHDITSTNFTLVAEWEGHRDAVRSLAWHPEGGKLATGSFREVAMWDPETQIAIWSVASNLLGSVTALEFTSRGDALIVADGAVAQSGWVRFFSAESGKSGAAWQGHMDTIFDLAVSRDGQLLATAGSDKLAKVWELSSQKEITQLEHGGAVLGLAFNTNATELGTVGADKQLKVWDLKTGQSIVSAGPKKHGLTAVAWSGDGKVIVTVDEEGALHSYTDLARHSGEQSSRTAKEKQLHHWAEPLHAVALSERGDQIFAVGQDGTVYVSDTKGKLLAKLESAKIVRSAAAADSARGREPTAEKLGYPFDPADRERVAGGLAQGGLKKRRPPSNTSPPTPSFVRDVLPMMAKAGCMAGSCHAKAEGQNGFKLSVFSYDPKNDYAEIVKKGRGRRIFPAAPAESLLLLKPTMAMEHGGGQRFETGSETYNLLIDWIRGGLVYQHPDEPGLIRIRVEPRERIYQKKASRQLSVKADYSDGSVRDVTRLAGFVANDKEIAQVNDEGLLQIGTVSGQSVIVARYMGFVDTASVTVPAERTLPAKRYAKLPVHNFIDKMAYAQFRELGLFPSDLCTDAEFLRRSSLDAIGRLPTADEARGFLSSGDPDKRKQWIDRLLAHPGYGDYWANKWSDLLRPNPDRVGVKSVFILDQWLRESFRSNKSYDQFVREILLAEGSNHRDGPIVIYRDRREPVEITTMFSQLFLGTRMECAKCHHHPNEKWTQDDFYQFAAFFGSLKQKGAGLSPPISAGTETFYFAPGGTVKHPVSETVMKPRPPDGQITNIATNSDARGVLADWLTSPQNPFFARAAVNRVWAAFFGRGFVEPVDDFRASNPAVNEPLLKAVAEDFAARGYDFKHLMRTILSSRLYQLSSTPQKLELTDTKNFSRSYRRRLPAEVLLDAVNDVIGVSDQYNGCPPGTRALQTWSYKISSQFMDAFGRPNPSSDAPCERDTHPSVVQSLHMMNSKSLQAKLSNPESRVQKLAGSKSSPREIVTELYLTAFSRFPTEEELRVATAAYAAPDASRQTATEDVVWALLNSAEFVFNH